MEQSIKLSSYDLILKKFLEVKRNMDKPKTIDFTGDELKFIKEQSAYENYVDELIKKARVEGVLDSDELAELECCDKVEYAEFLNEDDLNIDSKMKLVLTTGEEIEFELV